MGTIELVVNKKLEQCFKLMCIKCGGTFVYRMIPVRGGKIICPGCGADL